MEAHMKAKVKYLIIWTVVLLNIIMVFYIFIYLLLLKVILF